MPQFTVIKNQKRESFLFRRRLLAIILILAILIGILVERLFYLQLVRHKTYSTLSRKNHVSLLPIEPTRGLIFDRNGILLAENVPVYSLDIVRDQVKDLDKIVNQLKNIVNISEDDINDFHTALSHTKRSQPTTLKVNLAEKEIAKFYLNQYRFPGVIIQPHMLRHYPLGAITSHVLGYVGRINAQELQIIDRNNYSASNFIGKVGIEKHYENKLHGKVGYKQVEVDATGHIIRTLQSIPPTSGKDIYLTIDSKLQQVAQKAMGRENGAVVAIKPDAGEVLALVSAPSYDGNLFTTGIDRKTFSKMRKSVNKPLFNRAIRGLFPFGSTIKPFIALGALDSGSITPQFTVDDPGWFKLPDAEHIYHDWKAHGTVNITKAIIVSCDTFFYTLAPILGIRKIDKILNTFGFGEKTNIDMNEELPGIVASPEWKLEHIGYRWFTGDSVISIFGQGFMSTTPIALANATTILANRGTEYQPHLLLKEIDENGTAIETIPTLIRTVKLRHPKYWKLVIKAMQGVVKGPHGTARRIFANIPYSVAAKTGTAQLYSHNKRTEAELGITNFNIPKKLRDDSLFIAFAPVKKPQIVVAVVAENSSIAASVARKVLDAYIIK